MVTPCGFDPHPLYQTCEFDLAGFFVVEVMRAQGHEAYALLPLPDQYPRDTGTLKVQVYGIGYSFVMTPLVHFGCRPT